MRLDALGLEFDLVANARKRVGLDERTESLYIKNVESTDAPSS